MIALASCGRLAFEPETADAPLGCWPSPIDLSENAGASYAPTLASDGTGLYVAWTDATGYVHDLQLGTENLFFRAVGLDGATPNPVVEIPKSDLGTNRNQFPSLLALGGGLVMTYSAQHGASPDSAYRNRWGSTGHTEGCLTRH